jgi:DUF1680 family protein
MAMNDKPILSHDPLETIRYPDAGQVTLSGRLSARYQGNQRYLTDIYERKKDWMLEPFRNRGQEWVLEPLRNRKQELNWAGEYAGKWLDAASLVAAGSRDAQFSQNSAAFAAALISAQDEDGYLGIEAPAKRGNSEWDVWNIKYALTGLLTHYEVQHDQAALQAAGRGGEWLIDRFGTISDSSHPFFCGPYEGAVSVDVVDQLVRLHHFTRDRKFLEFASSVVAHFPPIARMRSTHQAPLIHAYNLTAYLGGVVDLAVADNREEELHWLERVWEDLAQRHVYPTGSLGFGEELRESAPNDTPVDGGQPERHHQETCATVEWLLFTAQLYQVTGRVRYMQMMEQAIYNALLAAQSREGMSWMYFLPLRYEKRWFTGPTSCCYWSGPRGIARLPNWVYALDAEGLRVNLYESSDATFRLHGRAVAVQQVSLYPDRGQVQLQIQPEMPLSFTLRLRIPFHAGQAQFKLNGQPMPAVSVADGCYEIRRTWSPGDRVEMEFGIQVGMRHFLNDRYGVLVRGPEVLAVDQRDNGSLDLDQLSLQEGLVLRRLEPVDSRRRYVGEVEANGHSVPVVFTPYADCGGDGARFRTAFPVSGRLQK